MASIDVAKSIIERGIGLEELAPLVVREPWIVRQGELLHLAVLQDTPAAIEALGPARAHCDVDYFGQTALNLACTYGGSRLACIRVLLRQGASPFISDDEGYSPLMHAAGFSLDEDKDSGAVQTVVDVLLAAARDRVHHLFRQQDSRGWGVLHHAVDGGHPGILPRLLASSTAGLAVQDRRGRTALHVAIQQGNADAVATLIRHGAPPLLTDASGLLPLDEALLSFPNGVEIVKVSQTSTACPPAMGSTSERYLTHMHA